MKPRWADFTDPGLGVGVSNSGVQFRDAELARIFSSDYRVRVHRARGDSGQNEAERTNSAIGDSVVDGATIKWEHFKRFDGLSADEITELTLEAFERMEEERMTKNAWRVANQVAARIDDAPVHSEYIKCIVAEKPVDGLFFNQEYLRKYFRSKASHRRLSIPGSGYMSMINNFCGSHYEYGELYMEYLKSDYVRLSQTKLLCNFCKESEWISPVMQRIPRPLPDESRLPNFHYLSVFDTPAGANRPPDEWQPRHNIKKQFEDGTLKLDNKESISTFSRHFIVDKELVREYLQHLVELQQMRNLRKLDRHQKRTEKQNKTFDDYDWELLAQNGQLQKLLSSELDKYLNKFNLSLKGKNADKVRRITAHVCYQKKEDIVSVVNNDSNEDDTSSDFDEESDSDDDIILANHESDSSSEEDDDEYERRKLEADSNQSQSQEGPVPVVTRLPAQTRSGRAIAVPQLRYRDCHFFLK